jgi:hypothetical protein
MKNKKASGPMGEMIIMMYRIVIIVIVGFIILGISVYSYKNDLNIKQTESFILAKNIYNCFINENTFNPDKIDNLYKNKILDYCGYNDSETKRFYVNISINEGANNIYSYSHGDSGKIWIIDIMESMDTNEELNSWPGYTKLSYPIYVRNKKMQINVVTLVTDE